MIIDEWFAGAALGRLAGVAGAVGLLELPDVGVGRQVVVGVAAPLLLLPGGLPGAGAGTVTLLCQAPAHYGDIRVKTRILKTERIKNKIVIATF